MKRLLTAGIFGTILGIVSAGTANASIVSSGFLDEKLTEYALSTSLDLKANQSDLVKLSNIVGTPKKLTYGDIFERSYISEIMGGVYSDTYADNTVPTSDISELINLNYTDTNFPGLAGVVESLFFQRDRNDVWPIRLSEIFDDYEYLYFEGKTSFTDLIINGGKLSNMNVTVYGLQDLTTKVDTNTAKIGDLPSGNFPIFPYSKQMFDIINFEYPQNLSQLIYALFGNTETNTHGALSYLMNDIIGNVPFGDNNISEIIGEPIQTGRYTIPIYELIYWGTNNSTYLLPNTNGTFSDAPLLGLYELSNRIDKIGTVPDGKNLAGMIGTLPAGYDSVGAALTAIKGIAEDAKAAALAAIPDPKQEGSSGKFVLTVDIVGDNATYRWEKIDREGETTTTTE